MFCRNDFVTGSIIRGKSKSILSDNKQFNIFIQKVVLALEGGYVGSAVAESATECLKVLLGDHHTKVSSAELDRPPCKQAALDISKTIANLVKSIR